MTAAAARLVLILAAVYFALEVSSGYLVCYLGQEFGPNSDGLQWYLTSEDPGECAEFRPGGMCTGRYRKLREVAVGGDRNVLQILTQRTATEDSQDEMTTNSTTSPCARRVTSQTNGLSWYPAQGLLGSKLERMEFKVQISAIVTVFLLDANNASTYSVDLGSQSCSITQWRNSSVTEKTLAEEGVTFPGRLWLTYSNGELQVGRAGSDAPLMNLLDHGSRVPEIWRVMFFSFPYPAEFLIYTPCQY